MKTIRKSALALLFCAGLTLISTGVTFAQSAQQVKTGVDSISDGSAPSYETVIKNGVNLFLAVIGAMAVIMIIYGGFKYITSAGDATAVTSAKNTIMYAVIGLIIVVLAGFIANFAINIFNGQSSPSSGTSGEVSTGGEALIENIGE